MLTTKSPSPLDLLADLNEFHQHFGFEQRLPGQPLDPALTAFRTRFIAEELHELTTALKRQHVPEVLDALVDICYVAIGTAWLLGLPFAEAWRAVHAANMQKVRAERASDSKRGSVFDVVKPRGWQKPDIAALVAPDDLLLVLPRSKPNKQLDLVEYLAQLAQEEEK